MGTGTGTALRYVMLGFLGWRPFTGYELKKVFAGSTTLYWSGNNNQIYTTLVQLHRDGLVELRTEQQESLPPRKIYSITEQGRSALARWVRSAPEAPEARNVFLLQLAWADVLSPEELDTLIAQYRQEIEAQLLMHEERTRRREISPDRTAREKVLWNMIAAHESSVFRNELTWLSRLREELSRARRAR